jgi:hypothetical protein
MATNGTNVVTYLDFAKRLDESGKVEKNIIEIMVQMNQILEDMSIVEGNLATGHKTTVRTGLPSATWRLLNYGVQPSKSATAQITDTCGMLEAYAQVDKSLADLNGNSAAWRLSEEKAFIEAMNQTMAYTMFYGDTGVNPERFLGLAPRYGALSGAASCANVIDGGGSSNLTSIYLVIWSPETVHAIYPKGSKAGIVFEDKGQVTLTDNQTPGGMYEGYRSHYKWDLGLTVRDWRYVVRIANLDTVALATAGDASDTSANLVKLMVKAMNLPLNLNAGKAVWYMNNTVKTYLEVKLLNAKNLFLQMRELTDGSGFVTTFMGVPIRRVDQIVNSETKLT